MTVRVAKGRCRRVPLPGLPSSHVPEQLRDKATCAGEVLYLRTVVPSRQSLLRAVVPGSSRGATPGSSALNFIPLGRTRVNCVLSAARQWHLSGPRRPAPGRQGKRFSSPALPHPVPGRVLPIIGPFSLERLEPQLLPIFPKLCRALVISLGFL